MKPIEGILATCRLDKHHHVLMPEALEGMVRQINAEYLPMWVEHDVALPPVGRWVRAELVRLEDGVLAVKGYGEYWDQEDVVGGISSDGRVMALHFSNHPTFELRFDPSFDDSEGKALIAEMQQIGARPQLELRKSAAILSQITIAAGIIIAPIAAGFLAKVGEDAYEALKKSLQRLRSKKDHLTQDRATRILFSFTVESRGKKLNAEVVLDNATDQMIEQFFAEGMKELDSFVDQALERDDRVVRVTTRQTEKGLIPLFAVRDDCVPLKMSPPLVASEWPDEHGRIPSDGRDAQTDS